MNQQNLKPKKRLRNEESWKKNVRNLANVNGIAHLRTNGILAPARQLRDLHCTCNPTCSTKLSNHEKQLIFTSFYNLSSHTEQNIYLRGCIINKGSRKNTYAVVAAGISIVVCTKYFLGLHDIKESRLKRKVLNRMEPAADMRGKHQSHRKVDQNALFDIRAFLGSLEARESHYSRDKNKNKIYLESNLNITKLYKDLLLRHPQYTANRQNPFEVKYYLFEKIFNYEFNIGFGFPRSDICEFCEQMNVKIKAAEQQQQAESLDELLTHQMEHWLEAEAFYESMKSDTLAALPVDEYCLTMDFEKNLPLPVTNVSSEYFLSQLWLFNFCIHNLRTEHAHMFVYAEHFAKKSSNEVISCLKWYIEKVIPPAFQVLRIWADNSFGQNKNRYLLAFLHQLTGNRFREIHISFPVVGHSRTRCDKNFALIEKQKKKNDRFSFPSHWIALIKSAKPCKPFDVIYVQHPLTDDLRDDGTQIVKVQDFKTYLDPVLRPPAEINLKRKFRFRAGEIKYSESTDGSCDSDFELLKPNITVAELRNIIITSPGAYLAYCELSKTKKKNIKKLLENVTIPAAKTFYESLNLNGEDDDAQSQSDEDI